MHVRWCQISVHQYSSVVFLVSLSHLFPNRIFSNPRSTHTLIARPKTSEPMRVRIHCGCHEIGGNCVEIESQGERIVLDIGLPLSNEASVDLPKISGLAEPDNRLRGIIISHPHPDHYGLLDRVTQDVPIYIGAAASRIIGVSSFFTRLPGLGNRPTLPLVDGQTIQIGPFSITPPLSHRSLGVRQLLPARRSEWKASVLYRRRSRPRL